MTTSDVVLKPPTTYDKQIEILRSRGLIISDEARALSILKRVNYYRFTAYALTFKQDDVFFTDTTFDKIYRHYEFDTRLRQHLMKVVEYVEISFRTHLSYTIAHRYGPDGYEDEIMFYNAAWCKDFNEELSKSIAKSKDPFVIHHIAKYSGKFPIWVAVEVLTFSWLSKLFKNLKNKDKKEISKYYNLRYEEISNWLHVLTIVRNRCAHYSRMFNQKLPVSVKFRELDKAKVIKENQLYAMIFNLKYLVTDISIWKTWVIELESIIEEYNDVDIRLLGFHEEWKEQLEK
ncbi:Abi family protein [Paenibacillus sp. GCM10012303]|uniref:Abi family protein n=1 Tax=Paenibacillus sp. GCM10012303 TaxID=3317340 RepID=UPI0036133520